MKKVNKALLVAMAGISLMIPISTINTKADSLKTSPISNYRIKMNNDINRPNSYGFKGYNHYRNHAIDLNGYQANDKNYNGEHDYNKLTPEQEHKFEKRLKKAPIGDIDFYKHSDVNAHYDSNYKDINNMHQFAEKREPYLYSNIGGNTRDLGGYPTANGKYETKTDRIIRSSSLHDMDEQGLKELKHLHVKKVIDLRFSSGKNGSKNVPDPDEDYSKYLSGSHIRYSHEPVYSHMQDTNLDKVLDYNHVDGKEYFYYGFLSVKSPRAIKTYRNIFHILLKNHHGAILYHCNLGRDRTGVTSALILSALGVKQSTIYHDYLLTDYYHYNYGNAAQMPYSRQADELKHFFKTIHHDYGSVDNYLEDKVGLSHSDLKKLRKMYLTPAKSDDYEHHYDSGYEHHEKENSHHYYSHHEYKHSSDYHKESHEHYSSKHHEGYSHSKHHEYRKHHESGFRKMVKHIHHFFKKVGHHISKHLVHLHGLKFLK